MPKSEKQNLRLWYLARIMASETDEEHGLTLKEISEKLEPYGIRAGRRTLYSDIALLREAGMDIVAGQDHKRYTYALVSHTFELPELKLLVDSVQAAKFITEKKSRSLIRKLEGLISRYQATHLQRQVIITGRVKTMNESIYYNVDELHEAISADRQIRFRYFQWNLKKEPELRHGGAWYHVSPWALVWDNEYYYLIGYDSADQKIKHYRVDKMLRISVTKAKREGRETFEKMDMARYSTSLFGMYGGQDMSVTLEAANRMVGILIDRFGKDIPIMPVDDGYFRTRVQVALSPQFLGWIMALGSGIRITGPEEAVEQMRESARMLTQLYPDPAGDADAAMDS